MKVIVLGTRGFPNVQGGVEKHCEELYPHLVALGCQVIVIGRSPYIGKKSYEYKGVLILPLVCPRNKFLEAFLHTFLGVIRARQMGCDALHIHAIGPSLFVPWARFLGFKVVMTHHGPDYERKKWNRIAKFVLKLGERFGVGFANEVICISQTIAGDILKKCGRKVIVIPNGVPIPEVLTSEEALKRYGLQKGKYLLAVGRFVREKGFPDLIEALPSDQKLVIVGDADHEDEYSLSLKKQAGERKNVILTGFLSGQPLRELYSHAGLFVIPSYYEGLPIVLLEAMSYGLSCLASDIPANKETGLSQERFFPVSNIEALKAKIRELAQKPISNAEKIQQIELIKRQNDWESIAKRTSEIYQKY